MNMFYPYALLLLSVLVLSVQSQCPTGFEHHDDSCYFVETNFNIQESWVDAKGYCKAINADLVIIDSQREQTYLALKVAENAGREYWTDGSDLLKEGKWIWMNTLKDMEYTAWFPGEPNNHQDKEDCMVISKAEKLLWKDISCDEKRRFICEKNLTLSVAPIFG